MKRTSTDQKLEHETWSIAELIDAVRLCKTGIVLLNNPTNMLTKVVKQDLIHELENIADSETGHQGQLPLYCALIEVLVDFCLDDELAFLRLYGVDYTKLHVYQERIEDAKEEKNEEELQVDG